MEHNTTPRSTKVVLAICGFVVFLSLLTAGVALYDRFAQTNEKRTQQAAFNKATTKTFVDLLCFVRYFNDGTKQSPAQTRAADAFIHGALKSIRAPVNSCDTPPHAP